MRSPISMLRSLIFALCLPLALGAGCNLDEVLEDHGPKKRRAKQGDVHCFSSFGKVKREMHRRGTPKRQGWQWHHIVGQNKLNIATYEAYDLHCTDNLIYVDQATHIKITTHYNKGHRFTGGQQLYKWLAAKSFDDQYEYGRKILKRHGFSL